MPSPGQWIVEMNRLPEMAAEIHRAIDEAIRKACFDVEAQAAANAPVDTGYLKNSIYVVTKDSSTYDIGLADRPPKGGALLPAVDPPHHGHEGYVAVGASYAVYVELGTSKMAAQPFLSPAADAVRPSFIAALELLEERLTHLGV